MSQLIIFGIERNWDEELEINADLKQMPYGYDCEIHYKNGEVEQRNNCTEVHHRHEGLGSMVPVGCAFESDIHYTGGTILLERIDKVVVEVAVKKHDNY